MTKAGAAKEALMGEAAASEAEEEVEAKAVRPKGDPTRKARLRAEAAQAHADAEAAQAAKAAKAERTLGRGVVIGLPAITLVAAIAVGVVTSAGPAILILVSGALLGSIALLWASLRTLGGDAPLPEGMDKVDARRFLASAGAEKRRTVLRALKDLEHEHAIGKIDDEDYAQIVADYRAQAKELMRDMDAEIAPVRAKAEQIARTYLERRGIVPGDERAEAEAPKEEPEARVGCPKCGASNDDDAAFCKKCGTAIQAGDTKGNDDASA